MGTKNIEFYQNNSKPHVQKNSAKAESFRFNFGRSQIWSDRLGLEQIKVGPKLDQVGLI